MPESVAVNIRRRSYTIAAGVDVETAEAEACCSRRARGLGGHALYVKDGRLHYTYNWLGEREQTVSSDADDPTGSHVLAAEFQKTGDDEQTMSATGTLALYIDDRAPSARPTIDDPAGHVRAQRRRRSRRPRQRLSRGLHDYAGTLPFIGGTIERVVIDVSGDHYIDHEKEVLAYLARD